VSVKETDEDGANEVGREADRLPVSDVSENI